MVSVAASIAGTTFSLNSDKIWGNEEVAVNGYPIYFPIRKPAYFDARAFVLPKEDVTNYFLWRQQDATRNSVQMLARSLYSHKQCEDKNNLELQEMCFQKGINWNDCPIPQKRGRCIIKQTETKPVVNKKTGEASLTTRRSWVVDNKIPIFSKDRSYIDKLVYVETK